MELIRPCETYLPEYRAAILEEALRPDAERIFGDPETIVEKSRRYEEGVDLKPGRVPQTTFWLVDGPRFLGEIHIRHALTPALLQYAGNIGYGIRASETGKGYGSAMLHLALEYCRSMNMEKVLITCDDENSASARVIEKNGGILENKVLNCTDRGMVLTRRYWITL